MLPEIRGVADRRRHGVLLINSAILLGRTRANFVTAYSSYFFACASFGPAAGPDHVVMQRNEQIDGGS